MFVDVPLQDPMGFFDRPWSGRPPQTVGSTLRRRLLAWLGRRRAGGDNRSGVGGGGRFYVDHFACVVIGDAGSPEVPR